MIAEMEDVQMTAKEAYDLVISGGYVSDRKTYDELKMAAAMALLKQIPRPFLKESGVKLIHYTCVACHHGIADKYNYCPRCGQMIDWSGKE